MKLKIKYRQAIVTATFKGIKLTFDGQNTPVEQYAFFATHGFSELFEPERVIEFKGVPPEKN